MLNKIILLVSYNWSLKLYRRDEWQVLYSTIKTHITFNQSGISSDDRDWASLTQLAKECIKWFRYSWRLEIISIAGYLKTTDQKLRITP